MYLVKHLVSHPTTLKNKQTDNQFINVTWDMTIKKRRLACISYKIYLPVSLVLTILIFDLSAAITTIKKPGNFQTIVHIIAEYVILEKYRLSQ